MPEQIILRNTQAPGDLIVLTAAIRELHKAAPGRFTFGIDTKDKHLFQNNPWVDLSLKPSKGLRTIVARYPMIQQSNQNRIHFMQAFLEYLNGQLGTHAVLTEFRPDLHLTELEKLGPPLGVKKPYWVFASGGKRDFSAKWWDTDRWQVVVSEMAKWTTLVQVGGRGQQNDHTHPVLNDVVNLVHKTSFRELMQLIYHSEGVMSVVTCLMHIAAAFNKPAVVVAGGREGYYWEAYTKESRLACMRRGIPNWKPPENDTFIPHRFLHNVGTGVDPLEVLSCCRTGGCWKSRIGVKDKRATYTVCTDQIKLPTKYLPHCLDIITPEHVLSAVDSYYTGGYLKRTTEPVARAVPTPRATPAAAVPQHVELYQAKDEDVIVAPLEPLPGTVQEAGKRQCTTGVDLVWMALSVSLRSDALRQSITLYELADVSPMGIVCWALVTDELRHWVKARYENPRPFDKHPIDPKQEIVYYPRKGFLCLPAKVVPLIDWTDNSDDFEIHVGAALHNAGIELRDAGHLVRGV